MCPDQELNQRPFALQDDAQPVEPLQSGLNLQLSVSDLLKARTFQKTVVSIAMRPWTNDLSSPNDSIFIDE